MRNSILGFNQNAAINNNLKIDDLLLLQYIIQANSEPGMSHIIDENEICYVWLNHAKIQEDLPILNITEGTLKNKLSKLKNDGFINSKSIANKSGRGSRTYYSITEMTMSLLNDVIATTSRYNDVEPGPRHATMTSNNKLNNDNKLNKTFTNVNVSSEAAEHTKIEESCFNFGTKKETKPKKSLYQKCIDLINDYTTDEKLKNVLIQYLDFRLENSQTTGKPFYSNNFKGLLNTLDKVIKESDSTVTKIDIVQKALNGCYMNFFAVNNINTGNNKIFKENIDEPQRKVDRNNLAKDEDGNYLIY